jgi:hypothetical protein
MEDVEMSYSIGIGNAIPEITDNYLYGFGWTVECVQLDDAPHWPGADISGKGNYRYPAYLGMRDFCEQAKITSLFFGDCEDDGALLFHHPGIAHLRREHLEVISAARMRYELDHPGAVLGWNDDCDPVLARLVWYEFWMRWALENCEHPAVCNS